MSKEKINKEFFRLKVLFKIQDEEFEEDIHLKKKLRTFSRLSINCTDNVGVNALKLFKNADYSYIIKYCEQNTKHKNEGIRLNECNIIKHDMNLYNKIKKFCKIHKKWEKYIFHIKNKTNQFRCICGQKHVVHLFPIKYKEKLYVIGSECIFSIDLMLRSEMLNDNQINGLNQCVQVHKEYLKNKNKKYCCIGCNISYNSKINTKYCKKCSSDIKKIYEQKYRYFKVLFGEYRNARFSHLPKPDLYKYLNSSFCKNNKKYSNDFKKLKDYFLGIIESDKFNTKTKT